CDFDGGEVDPALSERFADEGRNGDRSHRSTFKEAPDFAIPDHAIEQAGPAGAFARPEQRAYQRKNAGWLHQQPPLTIDHPLPVEFGQAPFEVVIDQGDRQVSRALDNDNAQTAQRRGQLSGALDVERFYPHATSPEIFFRLARWKPETGPIGGNGACGSPRCLHDVATLDQAVDRFVDLVGGELSGKLSPQRLRALSALADCLCDRAVKLSVQEKLPILGIEADDARR